MERVSGELGDPDVRLVNVETAEDAQRLRFLGSPTIRVNGWDWSLVPTSVRTSENPAGSTRLAPVSRDNRTKRGYRTLSARLVATDSRSAGAGYGLRLRRRLRIASTRVRFPPAFGVSAGCFTTAFTCLISLRPSGLVATFRT